MRRRERISLRMNKMIDNLNKDRQWKRETIRFHTSSVHIGVNVLLSNRNNKRYGCADVFNTFICRANCKYCGHSIIPHLSRWIDLYMNSYEWPSKDDTIKSISDWYNRVKCGENECIKNAYSPARVSYARHARRTVNASNNMCDSVNIKYTYLLRFVWEVQNYK